LYLSIKNVRLLTRMEDMIMKTMILDAKHTFGRRNLLRNYMNLFVGMPQGNSYFMWDKRENENDASTSL